MLTPTMNLSEIRQWLVDNKPTRMRPRIRGSGVTYIPRRGWSPGLNGFMPGAPYMFAPLQGPDQLDALFRELSIPVDSPL